MLIRRLFITVAALLLTACGPAPAQQAAPAATTIPLSVLDVEPLLIQLGDLPAGMEGAQVLDTPPAPYEAMEISAADKLVFQRLQRSGQPAGYVIVSLYEDQATGDGVYARLVKDIGAGGEAKPLADVGEQGMITDAVAPLVGAHAVFQRCHAVVDVLLTGDLVDQQAVTAYAKRIDQRLRSLVCL